MIRAETVLAAALAALVPLAAGGTEPHAAPEPYPVAVRIAIVAGAAGAELTIPKSERSTYPPEPYGTANLEEQARAAYGDLARRTFREVVAGEAGDADLELQISVEAADVAQRGATGSHASVEHAIVLRTRDRTELARWRLGADAEFVATSEHAMADALVRAAASAARRLEAEFERPAVAEWLTRRGIRTRSAPPPAALLQGPYPLAVRLSIVTGPLGSVYAVPRSDTTQWPPEPYGTANLDAQANAAYDAVARKMFRDVVAGEADAELEVSVAAVGLGHRSSGSLASVEHAIVLRTRDRGEVGRWRLGGEAEFVSSTEQTMPNALARAARDAAEQLEPQFEEVPAVAQWLRDRGIPIRAPMSASPRATPPGPSRTVFVDAGVGLMGWQQVAGGDASLEDGLDGNATRLSVKAGIFTGLLLVDISYARWTARSAFRSFTGAAGIVLDTADFNVTALGADAGLARRFRAVEVRCGLGWERFQGEAKGLSAPLSPTRPTQARTESLSGSGASIFGGFVYSICGIGPMCLRTGAELRRYFFSQVDALGAGVDVARTSISATIGVELPWGESSAR